MTGFEIVMQFVLAKLQTPPLTIVPVVANIRRKHRTAKTRSDSPGWDLIDGNDGPRTESMRAGSFTIAIILRTDDGPEKADVHKIDIMRRLNPELFAHPNGVTIKPGSITSDNEIADSDVVKIDMEFSFTYPACGWTL